MVRVRRTQEDKLGLATELTRLLKLKSVVTDKDGLWIDWDDVERVIKLRLKEGLG